MATSLHLPRIVSQQQQQQQPRSNISSVTVMDTDTTLAVVDRPLRLQPQNKYIPVGSSGHAATGISDVRKTDVN